MLYVIHACSNLSTGEIIETDNIGVVHSKGWKRFIKRAVKAGDEITFYTYTETEPRPYWHNDVTLDFN